MSSRADVGVLIAAAGSGERVGGTVPKQFRPIAGVPMLQRAIEPFLHHSRVLQIVVALPQAAIVEKPEFLKDLGGKVRCVVGGATRALSVKAALQNLEPGCDIVLVHDAARPFVQRATIDKVIDAASKRGVVPAVPVADTIKRADENTGLVTETVDRKGLWRAQTPQGCPRNLLERAYESLDPVLASGCTDEAALLEEAGFEVELVPDSAGNFKVTTEADFAVAEATLEKK